MQNNTAPMSDTDTRRAARIDQVLDAAADCFVEYGFHGAGMAKIAKRAGMSVGHIYHYFENKEAIIAAIVDRESELAAERFAEFNAVSSEELVHMMVERVDEMVHTKSDAFQSALNLEILAESQRNTEVAKIVRAHDTKVRDLFLDMLQNKLGLADAKPRTELLLSLFGGLATRILRNPGMERDTLLPLLRQIMHEVLAPGACERKEKDC